VEDRESGGRHHTSLAGIHLRLRITVERESRGVACRKTWAGAAFSGAAALSAAAIAMARTPGEKFMTKPFTFAAGDGHYEYILAAL
jgi:hypothetical protein